MSQKMQRQLERRQHGGMTAIKSKISGAVSSISFTPIQGIDIISMTPIDTSGPSTSKSAYFGANTKFAKVQTPLPK
jgi:hypothetical protein